EIDTGIAKTAIAELSDGRKSFSRHWRRTLSAVLLPCLGIAAFIIFSPARHLGSGKKIEPAVMVDSARITEKAETLPSATKTGLPLQWETLPESPYPAVNAIFQAWGIQTMPESKKRRSTASLVRSRGFSTIALTTLRDLVMLDTPAIVEIVAGKGGKTRFIALISTDGQTFRIAPELPGAPTISMGELAAVWTGRGRIIWRNSHRIPTDLQPDSEVDGVLKLQRLLADAGMYKGKQTGILDKSTMGAVMALQKTAGLNADGIPGDKTLLVLYRDYGRERSPRLSATRERQS
ncbi:MAG TPA: peptidoglycan-binding domain-containing protein, partial [Geobacteraceae bacterium]|nr:peptidoglycan-binding domain-containing protein [Geobacteraceae bacterium]